MIAVISVEITAANPQLPLFPWRAYLNSPSSLRIRNVPRRVGNWNIEKVYVTAAYPDNSIKTAQCVLVGGIWVCTIEGSTVSGFSQNGYTIYADGKDENGNEVTGYCLGKGDITILESDGTITPDEKSYYVHMLSAQPTSPKDGDLWQLSGTWYIYQDGTSYPIGDDSGLIQQISSELSNKADVSATILTPNYANPPIFTKWTFDGTEDISEIELQRDPLNNNIWCLTCVDNYSGEECKGYDDNGNSDEYATSLSFSIIKKIVDDEMLPLYVTANRTSIIIGYTLGNQYDKQLQPKGDYALSSDLSSKQDKLSDQQISAIDSVVDERATVITFSDNTTSSYNWVGDITKQTMIDAGIWDGQEYVWIKTITQADIGNTVTRIGDSAFENCSVLTSVTIPDSVTNIGNYAFQECPLTSMTIPDSAESIGANTFEACWKLTSVTIPNSVTSIGNYAFSYCTDITSVTIGNSVSSIGEWAFDGCTNLANITVVGKTQAQAEALLANAGVSPSIITTWNDASQEWVKEQNYISSIPSTYKTYQETVSSLSNDGYATTTYAVHNLSGVANITSIPLSSYEAISATADVETLYVITED